MSELRFEDVWAGYGADPVVRGVSLTVSGGEANSMFAAASALCGVKREVGVAHESVGASASGIADRDADRGADHDLVPLDEIRP